MTDSPIVGNAHIDNAPQFPDETSEPKAIAARYAAGPHALEWAVGGFLFLVGGAMLVSPHDYVVVWRVVPLPGPGWWGALYLLAGLAMMALPTMSPTAWFSVVAYLVAAGLMLVLAAVYALVGRLIGVAGYVPMAVGCLAALVMDHPPPRARAQVSREVRGHLLRGALGLCGVLSGVVLLAAPGHSAGPAFDAIRPILPWSGVVLVLAGSALACLPLMPIPDDLRTAVAKAASVSAGTLCMAYVVIAVRQGTNWPGIAYWGWLGLVMGAQPLLPERARRSLLPGSLRTRLAFLLAGAAAIPLILVVALVSDGMERSARLEGLAQQTTQAVALSEKLSSYITLHRDALDALAAQPLLAGMSRDDQLREIMSYSRLFPDVSFFALYAADGSLIVGSGGISQPQSVAGSPGYQNVSSTGKRSMDVLASPPLQASVLNFMAPVYDEHGRLAGLASTAIEASRLAEFLKAESRGQGHVRVVDDSGQAIVRPDTDPIAPPAAPDTMLVATVRSQQAPDGSLVYWSASDEQLAGFARVSDLNWILIAEESSDEVLAGVRIGRENIFVILLASIFATVITGWWMAGYLATPLTALAHASEALTAGDAEAPLPTTGILETDYLARTFGAMRKALTEPSAKLQQSESELRQAADHLMAANRALEQGQSQQRALTRRLLEIQEDERRLLSMDLHDTAAQSMTALGIGLRVLEDASCTPAQLASIRTLRQTAEAVMEDLHRLAVNLRPSSLDRSGLVAALEQLVASFRTQSGAHVTFLAQGMNGQRLPGNVETALYRVVQESLTNIARHAQAGQIGIVLTRKDGAVQVIVEDDGVGFDVDEALARGRLGLLGMRERADMLGGMLRVESREGAGATVYASFPIRPQDPGSESAATPAR